MSKKTPLTPCYSALLGFPEETIPLLVNILFFLWPLIFLINARLFVVPFILISFLLIPSHKFALVKKSWKSPVFLLLESFVGWIGFSVMWAPEQKQALGEFFKIAPIFLGIISMACHLDSLDQVSFKRLLGFFLAGWALLFLITFIDRLLGLPISHIKKQIPAKDYCYADVILLIGYGLTYFHVSDNFFRKLPLGNFSLFLKKMISYVLVGGLLLYITLSHEYDAGPIALGVGLTFFCLTTMLPTFLPKFIRYGIISLTLMIPLLTGKLLTPQTWGFFIEHQVPSSYRQRLEIVEWGVHYIKEKPVLGWGIGQTRYLNTLSAPRNQEFDEKGVPRTSYAKNYLDYLETFPEEREKRGFKKDFKPEVLAFWTANIWHMHNGFLQIWLELGLIGILLCCGIVWLGLKRFETYHLKSRERGILYGFFLGLLLIFAVSFGIWQSWWLSTLGLSLLLYNKALHLRHARL